MGREVVRGIRRFTSVSDAEWHSELLHSSQPVQSEASCCFYTRYIPKLQIIKQKNVTCSVRKILLPFTPRIPRKNSFQLRFSIFLGSLQHPPNIALLLLQYYQHCCALQSLIYLRAQCWGHVMEDDAAIDCGSVPACRLWMLSTFTFSLRGLVSSWVLRSKVDIMLKSLHKKKKKKVREA